MEDLTSQKVNKWLFWLMVVFFIVVTYLNFYEIFHQLVHVVLNLPFWFFLTSTLLVTLLILNLIHSNDYKIKELEESLSEKQKQLMVMERKARLITQDITEITKDGFKYYCADILKVKGYQEVKVNSSKHDFDIEAVNLQGEVVYIKCFYDSLINSREQIHQLYYKMLQDGVEDGIILSNIPFTEEDQVWANTFNITYLHGKKINEIIQSFLEVDTSQLVSWL